MAPSFSWFSPPLQPLITCKEGHSSVGCIKNKEPPVLDGPTHRIPSPAQEMIKCFHQTPSPQLPQVGLRLPSQGSHPVTLAGSGEKRGPSPLFQSVGQPQADRLNGCLESTQVTLWSKLQNTSAHSTAISLQPQSFTDPIKISERKTVSPHSCNPTPRTEIRLGPWVSSAPSKDLLDLGCNKEYQDYRSGG